jgi:hypothetical protein
MAPESKMESTEFHLFQNVFFLFYYNFFSKIQNGARIQDGRQNLFSTRFFVLKMCVYVTLGIRTQRCDIYSPEKNVIIKCTTTRCNYNEKYIRYY